GGRGSNASQSVQARAQGSNRRLAPTPSPWRRITSFSVAIIGWSADRPLLPKDGRVTVEHASAKRAVLAWLNETFVNAPLIGVQPADSLTAARLFAAAAGNARQPASIWGRQVLIRIAILLVSAPHESSPLCQL